MTGPLVEYLSHGPWERPELNRDRVLPDYWLLRIHHPDGDVLFQLSVDKPHDAESEMYRFIHSLIADYNAAVADSKRIKVME